MLGRIIKEYNEAVFETDKDAAFEVANNALANGLSAEDVVFKVVIPAVEVMMADITRDPDANLAQHFMTAQIAAEVTEKMLLRFVHPPEIIGSRGDRHGGGRSAFARQAHRHGLPQGADGRGG